VLSTFYGGEGYTTGQQTLERTQYELDKAFVSYADE